MKRPKFLEKMIDEPKYVALIIISSIIDAKSTTINDFSTSTEEMSFILRPLMEILPTSAHMMAATVVPILFSTYIFHLWASPRYNTVGFYALNGLILAKLIASINNYLVYKGIYHSVMTLAIILAYLTPILIGIKKNDFELD